MTTSHSVTPAPYPDFTAMPIGGQWRAGRAGKTGADSDPWSGETLTEIPLASVDDLDEAFLVAEQAQREWAARPPADRAAVMLEAASMPHHVTGAIMPSDVPGKESRVYRQPAGVIAVISPWNFTTAHWVSMQRTPREFPVG